MAERPVFVSLNKKPYYRSVNTEFTFYSGFSATQKQKSMISLHEAFHKRFPDFKILEISSKSELTLGIALSAFNLKYKLENGDLASLESVFQSSKVFEFGGPYTDLLYAPPKTAKKDDRIRESGKITGFRLEGKDYATEPKTFFYNWIYAKALYENKDILEKLSEYSAFTDIEFNPNKSLNCQAIAAAIVVSLKNCGLLDEAMKDADSFMEIVYGDTKPGFEQLTIM